MSNSFACLIVRVHLWMYACLYASSWTYFIHILLNRNLLHFNENYCLICTKNAHFSRLFSIHSFGCLKNKTFVETISLFFFFYLHWRNSFWDFLSWWFFICRTCFLASIYSTSPFLWLYKLAPLPIAFPRNGWTDASSESTYFLYIFSELIFHHIFSGTECQHVLWICIDEWFRIFMRIQFHKQIPCFDFDFQHWTNGCACVDNKTIRTNCLPFQNSNFRKLLCTCHCRQYLTFLTLNSRTYMFKMSTN